MKENARQLAAKLADRLEQRADLLQSKHEGFGAVDDEAMAAEIQHDTLRTIAFELREILRDE